jgi:hypothetical protein
VKTGIFNGLCNFIKFSYNDRPSLLRFFWDQQFHNEDLDLSQLLFDRLNSEVDQNILKAEVEIALEMISTSLAESLADFLATSINIPTRSIITGDVMITTPKDNQTQPFVSLSNLLFGACLKISNILMMGNANISSIISQNGSDEFPVFQLNGVQNIQNFTIVNYFNTGKSAGLISLFCSETLSNNFTFTNAVITNNSLSYGGSIMAIDCEGIINLNNFDLSSNNV